MADVTVAVENIDQDGLDPAHTGSLSASNNYKFRNDGRLFLYVTNGGGSDCDVTISTPGSEGGNAIADRVVVVTAGEDRMIGPFQPRLFNDPDGDIDVTFSFITSVTVAGLHL